MTIEEEDVDLSSVNQSGAAPSVIVAGSTGGVEVDSGLSDDLFIVELGRTSAESQLVGGNGVVVILGGGAVVALQGLGALEVDTGDTAFGGVDHTVCLAFLQFSIR